MRFDRLYDYRELTAALEALGGLRPDLLRLSSIGRSYEGREIWLATVTNADTGPDSEKPALFVEANIHAGEITASTAALHLLHRLVTGYGSDAKVTRALDTRCCYVVPRANPDGAELALAARPRFIRASTRPWPDAEQRDGLIEEDMDGDGRILTMRIADPHGPWRECPQDRRLLVPREPDDEGGDGCYRLLPEGRVQNYDGVLVPLAPVLEGIDLNRQFPMGWRTLGDQPGAGPYPTSEPETRALAQAVAERPNLCAYLAYHTAGAAYLRPYAAHADEELPTEDLRLYQEIGRRATALTGYRTVSVFHDFRDDPKEVATGGSDDWAYDHLGLLAWTTEFWSPLPKAGISDYRLLDWFRDHSVEEDLAVLRWCDDTLGRGVGYIDWYPFQHPQLGPVELGGWDYFRVWTNPPAALMEAEIQPHTEFALLQLLMSPRLERHSVSVEALEGGVWRVRLVVRNTGWLATNVTQRALDRKAVHPVEARIVVPADTGASLVSGVTRVELGQLTGRAAKRNALYSSDPTTDWAKAEWIVRAAAGTTVRLEARHPRAGRVRVEVTLGHRGC